MYIFPRWSFNVSYNKYTYGIEMLIYCLIGLYVGV